MEAQAKKLQQAKKATGKPEADEEDEDQMHHVPVDMPSSSEEEGKLLARISIAG